MESSATSVRARRARFCWPDSRSSSIAATTAPASRCSTGPDRRRARGRQPERAARRDRGAATAGSAAARSRWPSGPAGTGIGHTRWATHGRVTEENAHPHFDTTDRVHIVVNGIVENYISLKRRLRRRGRRVHLARPTPRSSPTWSPHYNDGDLVDAVRRAYAELRGHYAFVAMTRGGARRARRRAQGVPADHRPRRGRAVHRLRDPRLPAPHAPRPVHRERRDRRAARPTASSSTPPTARRSSARSSRSTGTPTRPRSRATRRSCSRRSTSRPTRSPRRSASAPRAASGSTSATSAPIDDELLRDRARGS